MVNLEHFWKTYGKTAFIFSVLWVFGLLFNIMILALLVAGLSFVVLQGYRRFSHQTPMQKGKGTKAEQYLQNILGEVKVTKNSKMDHELEVLHEVFGDSNPCLNGPGMGGEKEE